MTPPLLYAAAPAKAPSASGRRALRIVSKHGRIAPGLLLAPGDRVERLVGLRIGGRRGRSSAARSSSGSASPLGARTTFAFR